MREREKSVIEKDRYIEREKPDSWPGGIKLFVYLLCRELKLTLENVYIYQEEIC